MKNIKEFYIYFIMMLCLLLKTASSSNLHILEAEDVHSCCNSPLNSREREYPQIFCYAGRTKALYHLFETVLLEISIPSDQYTLYKGKSVDEVNVEFESQRSLFWSMNPFSSKRSDVTLDPFNQTCVGVVSARNYKVELNIKRFDYWRVLLFVCGVVLFSYSPSLSKNVMFYYICGVLLGISASFLILIYIFSKILPRKPMMYGFVVGGWALSLYMIQLIWDNMRTLCIVYKNYVFGYFITTSVISFVVCYRFGPITNPRSKEIIKWAMQGFGLLAVLFSSDYQEATLAIDILILCYYNCPKSFNMYCKRAYHKYVNKPKLRLLSEDEYYEQGVLETTKALKELRSFCSSPDCNQWKTVTRLNNPVRFAQFVQGGPHLQDGEILSFESETNDCLMTADNFTDDSD